jgi:hypothetical protein
MPPGLPYCWAAAGAHTATMVLLQRLHQDDFTVYSMACKQINLAGKVATQQVPVPTRLLDQWTERLNSNFQGMPILNACTPLLVL